MSNAVSRNEPNGWRWLPVALAVIVLDQFTKQLVVTRLEYAELVELLPVLNLTHVYNPGAAFSFLAEASGWQRWLFAGLALVVGTIILVWLKRLKARSQWMLSCALALILGGALGNVIDRIRLGHVVDFVDAHWGGAHFPAFNVADAGITVGAVLLLLDAFLETRRAKAQSSADVKADHNPPAP
jgi:signal peptidase II